MATMCVFVFMFILTILAIHYTYLYIYMCALLYLRPNTLPRGPPVGSAPPRHLRLGGGGCYAHCRRRLSAGLPGGKEALHSPFTKKAPYDILNIITI